MFPLPPTATLRARLLAVHARNATPERVPVPSALWVGMGSAMMAMLFLIAFSLLFFNVGRWLGPVLRQWWLS
jgi:hypothetical protein